MKKLTTTLVCALAVLAFSAGAWAQSEDAAVDWDEAIEFAEVTDTYVENGVNWETRYDELQGAMWSQPADATPEAMKAYFTGDKETLKDLGLDDLCFIIWPVPNYLRFVDGASTYDYYNGDFDLYETGGNYKKWMTSVVEGMSDIDTSVTANVRNTTSYCEAGYQNRLIAPDDQETLLAPDTSTCATIYGFTYYSAYDTSHVEDWDYSEEYAYKVSRHRIYACEAYRYIYLMVGTGPE